MIATAITAAIPWHPIGCIPAALLDGRDVLLWRGRSVLCSWCDGWRDPVGRLVSGVTHYADIEGPAL